MNYNRQTRVYILVKRIFGLRKITIFPTENDCTPPPTPPVLLRVNTKNHKYWCKQAQYVKKCIKFSEIRVKPRISEFLKHTYFFAPTF